MPKLRDAIQEKLPNADMLSSIGGDEVIPLGAARQVSEHFPQNNCNMNPF